ncbi:MAG: hypothetical protein LUC98_02020 [Lachnospiraceae bacterium]|nr:hypothetical protein [Lachnospiraceae bacterium]
MNENENAVTGLFKLELDEPFEHDGKTYTELNFDFGKLRTKDMLSVEREMQSQGLYALSPKFSGDFLIRLAARASAERVGQGALSALPISAGSRLINYARNFL